MSTPHAQHQHIMTTLILFVRKRLASIDKMIMLTKYFLSQIQHMS
jgi:hypothetical protein